MKRVFLIILVLGLAGAAGFLGYRSIELSREKRALAEAVAQTERKAAQMRQRSEEEKARNAAAQRAKAAADTQRAEAEASLKAAQAEAITLKKAREELTHQVENLKKSQTAGHSELSKRIAALETEKAELNAKLQKAGEAGRGKDADIERLTKEGQGLRAEVDKAARDNARMREHNKKLVAIAEDLIVKYRQKGSAKGLLENEPFTQLGKIEYEKMRQDYLDLIDKEKIRR
jgi:penicillin-binding protein 1A